jgi:glycosyltransferase involved in cell wall biosynthesis
MNSDVSVIVPVFDREAVLGIAIESILQQSCEVAEVVVVDDGSSDGSAGVAEAFGGRVRCVRQKHAGVAAARNLGLSVARGDLIAFLDSDDVWPAGSLDIRVEALDANRSADVAYGRTRIRMTATDNRRFANFDENKPLHHPVLGSMLCRRAVFDAVGLFDETFEHSEDVDWLSRAKAKGVSLVQVDATVLEYRIHGGNMTLDVDRNQAYLLRALKKSLDARRRR